MCPSRIAIESYVEATIQARFSATLPCREAIENKRSRTAVSESTIDDMRSSLASVHGVDDERRTMSNDNISRSARKLSSYFNTPPKVVSLSEAKRQVLMNLNGKSSKGIEEMCRNVRVDWSCDLRVEDSSELDDLILKVSGISRITAYQGTYLGMDDESKDVILGVNLKQTDDEVCIELLSRGLDFPSFGWLEGFIDTYGSAERKVIEMIERSGIKVISPLAHTRGFEPSDKMLSLTRNARRQRQALSS